MTIGMTFKALFYVKLDSKHILLNKFSPKMPLNGRKWPRKAAAHHAAKSSKLSKYGRAEW